MVGGCRGYFTKELEKNLTQHKIDEFFLRYKLELIKKNFLDFIYGSPTSMRAKTRRLK